MNIQTLIEASEDRHFPMGPAELLGEAASGGKTKAVEHADLGQLAGTWTARDAREFERGTTTCRQVDEEHWR